MSLAVALIFLLGMLATLTSFASDGAASDGPGTPTEVVEAIVTPEPVPTPDSTPAPTPTPEPESEPTLEPTSAPESESVTEPEPTSNPEPKEPALEPEPTSGPEPTPAPETAFEPEPDKDPDAQPDETPPPATPEEDTDIPDTPVTLPVDDTTVALQMRSSASLTLGTDVRLGLSVSPMQEGIISGLRLLLPGDLFSLSSDDTLNAEQQAYFDGLGVTMNIVERAPEFADGPAIELVLPDISVKTIFYGSLHLNSVENLPTDARNPLGAAVYAGEQDVTGLLTYNRDSITFVVPPIEEPTETPTPTEEPTETPIDQTGSISGFLWVDAEGRGILETADPDEFNTAADVSSGEYDGPYPFAGFTVLLYSTDGGIAPLAAMSVDVDGVYIFETLDPGDYVVGLKSESAPGAEYLLPTVETEDNKFSVGLSGDPSLAYTGTIRLAAGQSVENINAGMLLAASEDLTNTDTIDLSKTPNKTGTGYTVAGVPYAYDPRFLVTDPSNGLTGYLTFNTGANGNVYQIVQTGIPNPGVGSPNGLKYGTSMIMNIDIQDKVNVTLVISDIHLIGSIAMTGSSNLTLLLEGTNYVRSNIRVPSTASITINSLNGDPSSDLLTIPPPADGNNADAGIGGSSSDNAGTITINGGGINITSGSTGAGIGGGKGGSAGTITINGGDINITSRSTGACIGGGGGNNSASGSGGTITINGGNINLTQYGSNYNTATGSGDSGAAIGAGGGDIMAHGSDGGAITINGGTVTIHQHARAAGIGSGTFGAPGTVLITGGTVNVYMVHQGSDTSSSGEGAGIGGCSGMGIPGATGYITITGGTVNVDAYWTGIGIVNSSQACHINISGGTVTAKGAKGPGIGFPVHYNGDDITITGGTVTASSRDSAGIGGTYPSDVAYVSPLRLDASADIKAYSGGAAPAINARNNTGDGYFVNASLDKAISATASTTLYVYTNGGHGIPLKTLALPAAYRNFAYSSDLAASRTDNVHVYSGSMITGTIVRAADKNRQIPSIIARAGYNAYNNSANNALLPVMLSAVDLGTGRYLVTRDSNGSLVGSYFYLQDAVNHCGADGPYTITATEDDIDVNANDPTLNPAGNAVNFPAGKTITLTSEAAALYTLTQSHSRRHFGVYGTLTLKNVILDVAPSTTPNPPGGGGIYVEGTLNMGDGAVLKNCVDDQPNGAGVYVTVYNKSAGTFNMTGGAILNNRAIRNGGGVYVINGGKFNMSGGTISGNTANGNGGGVYVDNGVFAMTGGAISNNLASGYGGGVYVTAGATFHMDGGTISGNAAPRGDGGGIHTENYTNYSNLSIASAAVFADNTASAAVDMRKTAAELITLYPTIQSVSHSVYAPLSLVHPLNNYDINVAHVTITVHYVDGSDAEIGTPAFRQYDVPAGYPFTLVGAEVPAITGYTFADWRIDSDAPRGNTAVTLPNVAVDTEIFLIYREVFDTTLTISKTVTGDFADRTRPFSFTVYFEDAAGNPLPEDTTFSCTGTGAPADGALTLEKEGKATFTLTHGQSVTIEGVASDGRARVAEETVHWYAASFTDSLDGSTGGSDTEMRPMTEDARTFDFKNDRTVPVETGISVDGVGPLLLLPAPALLAALLALMKKTAAYHRRGKEYC